MGNLNTLRLAKTLGLLASLNLAVCVYLHQAIYSEPTTSAMLVPRADGIFVVGENAFGLLRIKRFDSPSELNDFLSRQKLKVPESDFVMLKPLVRDVLLKNMKKENKDVQIPNFLSAKPVVETHSSESAAMFEILISDGNLRASPFGFAIQLETDQAITN